MHAHFKPFTLEMLSFKKITIFKKDTKTHLLSKHVVFLTYFLSYLFGKSTDLVAYV